MDLELIPKTLEYTLDRMPAFFFILFFYFSPPFPLICHPFVSVHLIASNGFVIVDTLQELE